MKVVIPAALMFLTLDTAESDRGEFCSVDKVLVDGSRSRISPNNSLGQCFALCGEMRDCQYWSWQSESKTCTTMTAFRRMEKNKTGVVGSKRCPGNVCRTAGDRAPDLTSAGLQDCRCGQLRTDSSLRTMFRDSQDDYHARSRIVGGSEVRPVRCFSSQFLYNSSRVSEESLPLDGAGGEQRNIQR